MKAMASAREVVVLGSGVGVARLATLDGVALGSQLTHEETHGTLVRRTPLNSYFCRWRPANVCRGSHATCARHRGGPCGRFGGLLADRARRGVGGFAELSGRGSVALCQVAKCIIMQYNCVHMFVHMYCHARVHVHNLERGSFSLTSGHPGWLDYFTMHVAHFIPLLAYSRCCISPLEALNGV